MKSRIEPQGVHFFCRKSGTHILFDEVATIEQEYSLGPRTVSIAITDECDFKCTYCYVNLRDRYLSKERIISFCKQLDELGTFEIAFGGGEPTLHPDLVEICSAIWNDTKLGISLTTHGHNLTDELINSLENIVSFIRISLDGPEPVYSALRGKPLSILLERMKYLNGKIPFGLNAVINKLSINYLDELTEIYRSSGAFEILILPMWNNGKYTLSTSEWQILENWILLNYHEIPIRISEGAKPFMNLPFLFDGNEWENDYGFISVDGLFKRDSFSKEGIRIDNYENLISLLNDRKVNSLKN